VNVVDVQNVELFPTEFTNKLPIPRQAFRNIDEGFSINVPMNKIVVVDVGVGVVVVVGVIVGVIVGVVVNVLVGVW